MKQIWIKFKPIEIQELLRLVENNIKSGEYWGNKTQYYKRMGIIQAKLKELEEKQNERD